MVREKEPETIKVVEDVSQHVQLAEGEENRMTRYRNIKERSEG